ncbi:MAG: sigma 54-interacting transcriptional regulator, partial [Desulfovibrionaceae bacterium]|nr:sigma 54-interacting transcriptional regulator [Desulfovibrionaceae bacterium]
EIGDLSPASQVKALRLLQEREYLPLGSDIPRLTNACIVAATNRPLEALLADGRFRKDLYFRLRTHNIEIPPLRKRRNDIPLLINQFLKTAARELGKKKPTPPDELYLLLLSYHFPGNVRELQALVFGAVSRHDRGKLSLEAFKAHIKKSAPRPDEAGPAPLSGTRTVFSFLDRLPTLKEAANQLTAEALKRAKGNLTQAADLIGVTRQALSARARKLGR